ncbi:MAG: hypothetical protein JWR80_9529 [Bradyrhizobium sp.]|nr:hypothetical protein [Bradyrhizobium sp.]
MPRSFTPPPPTQLPGYGGASWSLSCLTEIRNGNSSAQSNETLKARRVQRGASATTAAFGKVSNTSSA